MFFVIRPTTIGTNAPATKYDALCTWNPHVVSFRRSSLMLYRRWCPRASSSSPHKNEYAGTVKHSSPPSFSTRRISRSAARSSAHDCSTSPATIASNEFEATANSSTREQTRLLSPSICRNANVFSDPLRLHTRNSGASANSICAVHPMSSTRPSRLPCSACSGASRSSFRRVVYHHDSLSRRSSSNSEWMSILRVETEPAELYGTPRGKLSAPLNSQSPPVLKRATGNWPGVPPLSPVFGDRVGSAVRMTGSAPLPENTPATSPAPRATQPLAPTPTARAPS